MADFSSTGDWKTDALQPLAFFVLIAMVMVVELTLNGTNGVSSASGRALLLFGMLLWAVVYNLLRKVTWFKLAFGAVQIFGAMWVNWFQLAKLAQEGGWHQIGIDRAIFICGGIAVLSKGVKDIEEALTQKLKAPKKKGIQPSAESSVDVAKSQGK